MIARKGRQNSSTYSFIFFSLFSFSKILEENKDESHIKNTQQLIYYDLLCISTFLYLFFFLRQQHCVCVCVFEFVCEFIQNRFDRYNKTPTKDICLQLYSDLRTF